MSAANSDSACDVQILPASRPNEHVKSEEEDLIRARSAKLQSAFHTLFQVVPFLLMLTCTVFSKISLLNLTNQLRLLTWVNCNGNSTDNECLDQVDMQDEAEAIAVFWYIVIILMTPNLHTFIKSFLGVLWKSSQQNPWPSVVSGFVVS